MLNYYISKLVMLLKYKIKSLQEELSLSTIINMNA